MHGARQTALSPLHTPSSATAANLAGLRARKYGQRFATGFLQFLQSNELADVVVVDSRGQEHQCHMLLLAYHSDFFRRAFSNEFREKTERRVVLGFEDVACVWPAMLEYFYTEEIVLTDDNVMALLAMARELMVPKIQAFCSDYAQNSLESSNAIQYLNQAVQFNCDAFKDSCVALVSEGFASSFNKPTDGLPVEVMLEVLQHPNLSVQTEEQVLTFVSNYVQRHELDQATIRQLYEHVRFPFLSNERLSQLAQDESVPRDLLITSMATRLNLLDHPERLAPPSGGPSLGGTAAAAIATATLVSTGGSTSSPILGSSLDTPHLQPTLTPVASAASLMSLLPQSSSNVAPRKSYICTIEYGLPGGSEYASVPLEGVWEDLVGQLRVRVSGDVVEGDAESILRTHDDSAWFMVSGDSGQQPVWIEVEFPPNMRVVELTQYTFSHGMNFANHMFPYGISDSAWFQMKGLTTAVSAGEDEPFAPLRTQESCAMQLEYTVNIDPACKVPAWKRLRICAGESETGGSTRLSVRKLKLYGRVEISLTRDNAGKDLLAAWRRRRDTRPAARRQVPQP